MYVWDKRRYGKQHTKCEKCGGKIYWMDNIGTCTGACSRMEITKHKSAKAICGEMTSIICKIADIDLELGEYDRILGRTKRFERKTDRFTRQIEYDIMNRFTRLLHNKKIKEVVISAVRNYIEGEEERLEQEKKVLIQKHKQLSNTYWKRDV